jgi:mannose-6-phosphate isomerase-like protein (cupin superfamily)
MTTTDAKGREYSERPWGNYTVLDDEAVDHKVKRIVVEPGQRLSLQRHEHRSEHWFVVHGTATVIVGESTTQVPAGHAVDVPVGTAHRCENHGSEPVVFIEVQVGDYFGEDDIIRLEDDYGRSG